MAKGVLRGDRVADLGQGDTQMMTHHHKYLSLIKRPLILPCTAICEHTNYWMRKRKKSCFELHNWRLMDHIILVLTFVFLFLLKNDEMYFFNLLVLLHGGCYTRLDFKSCSQRLHYYSSCGRFSPSVLLPYSVSKPCGLFWKNVFVTINVKLK